MIIAADFVTDQLLPWELLEETGQKQTKLFEDIRELPLRQWVFRRLRFEEKKTAKRCVWHLASFSTQGKMAIPKAVARETEE